MNRQLLYNIKRPLRITLRVAAAAAVSCMALAGCSTLRRGGSKPMRAVYMGVKRPATDGAVSRDSLLFRFVADGTERDLALENRGGAYALHNRLKVGAQFDVSLSPADPTLISDLVMVDAAPAPYSPRISGTPGRRTLKNFLRTAFEPLGTTLYVYGGGWNWQDDGPAPEACTIGVPGEWRRFFLENDADYQYKSPDRDASYYPWDGYNTYHYAGADCSGFVGWTLYNTLETEPGRRGYVMSSLKMAREFADCGMGEFSKDVAYESFRPGDIVSMRGHVYIVVGRAADSSLLIVHSTVVGDKGSGVQLSGVGPDENCEAVAIARRYMSEHYPEWSSRYETAWKAPAIYLDFTPEDAGHMVWRLTDAGLTDPDGLSEMTADEILRALEKE